MQAASHEAVHNLETEARHDIHDERRYGKPRHGHQGIHDDAHERTDEAHSRNVDVFAYLVLFHSAHDSDSATGWDQVLVRWCIIPGTVHHLFSCEGHARKDEGGADGGAEYAALHVVRADHSGEQLGEEDVYDHAQGHAHDAEHHGLVNRVA